MSKVTLVGAGPGDPDLLTVKAVKAIQAAEVLLVDDLVSDAIMALAPASARIVHVGKRGGCAQTPQAFIERLMIAEVRAGHHVVRLKGGDPYMFGRGGEERAHLLAQGISVDVVPGITSGLAGAASIGIPLTHRDWSQGAVFVTGHGKDAQSEPNWPALAQSRLTLVIYMGVARCAQIQAGLLAGGASPDTPVAVVQSATRSAQRQLITTLGALPEALAASGIGSPAVIVVGDVVRCADAWPGEVDAVAATATRHAA
ncbi:MAG: uroporphyrinogen-III C-methyltransferase [Burkholderiaceae bacterium]|nr:uroporphyrinogen-III C-methyltransferase [Burkholderiaceae bacterium]